MDIGSAPTDRVKEDRVEKLGGVGLAGTRQQVRVLQRDGLIQMRLAVLGMILKRPGRSARLRVDPVDASSQLARLGGFETGLGAAKGDTDVVKHPRRGAIGVENTPSSLGSHTEHQMLPCERMRDPLDELGPCVHRVYRMILGSTVGQPRVAPASSDAVSL